MAIANHVSPKAAEFVEFVTMVIREDWKIDGKRVAPGARQFLAEIAGMIEALDRLSVAGRDRRHAALVSRTIEILESQPAFTLTGEKRLLDDATRTLNQANAIKSGKEAPP